MTPEKGFSTGKASSSNGLEHRPKLRFPGFDEPYRHRPLSDYLKENTDRNKKLRFSKDDVLSVSGEFGVVNQIAFQGRSFAGASVADYHIVETGDIVYTKSPLKANPYGIIKTNSGVPGIVSTLYAVYHPKRTVFSQYVDYYFANDLRLNKYLKPLVNIGAKHDMKINNEFALTGSVTFPEVCEQRKITEFLSKLDSRIDEQRGYIEILKKYKRGLLQNMFPRKGEAIPRFRLKGFANSWELHKFSDFTWNAGVRNKDGLDLEPYAITNEHGFIKQSEAHDDFGYMKNTDRTAYNIVKPNSFGYNPARINVGSIGYYEGSKEAIVSSLYEIFQTADYVDDRFLWHWFKSDDFSEWIWRLQEGSVRLYFYYDKLCECQLRMPSLSEQKKIAAALDGFDSLIALQQRELDNLTNCKKGLLQQLFI